MLATLSGTMLAPGVSKNGRLYTPDAIAKAVTRMQARLADENARPIVMRTHHDAGDDTTQIVGHLTAVQLDDDGAAKYEAVLNGTQAARDVLAATGDEDARSLRNVSIYGWWAGQPRTVRHEGRPVETADDIEIDAVDFTAFPGVEGARIDAVTPTGGKPRESTAGRHVITESAEAVLSFADSVTAPPRRRVRRLSRPTPTNGVTVTNETVHPAKLLGETVIGECYDCAYEDRAGFSISANNGPINVNISAWHGIDPAELEVIAKAAMAAACDALKALDPDMDADINVEGAPNADTDSSHNDDDAMESALPPTTVTPKDMAAFLARKKTAETTQTPEPTEAGPTVKESAMPDEKTVEQAATTTESAEQPLTLANLQAAMTEAFKPVVEAFQALATTAQTPATAPAPATTTTEQSAPATESAETAPAATAATESTTKVDVAAETKKAIDDIRETVLAAYGVPPRKGLVRTSESTQDATSPEQLWEQRSGVWNSVLPNGTPAAPTAPTGS